MSRTGILLLSLVLSGCVAGAAPPVEPPRSCKKDNDCTFVREPACNAVEAIRAGKEHEWEEWKRERLKELAAEKHYCRPGVERRKYSDFTLHCGRGQCEAWPRPVRL